MIHLFLDWLSFSPTEWFYIAFCSFCLGVLVGGFLSVYLQGWHIRQIMKENKKNEQG